MVEVKRKKGESFEGLIRKFTKRIQQSGKVLQAKKIRYDKKDPKKNLRKKLTLRRLKINAEREYLRKVGKLKEEDNRRDNRR